MGRNAKNGPSPRRAYSAEAAASAAKAGSRRSGDEGRAGGSGAGGAGSPARGRARRYAVLYREAAAWVVPDAGAGGAVPAGLRRAEADVPVTGAAQAGEGPRLPYPGDYAGVVIAVRPEGHEWGPGDLGDPRRKLVTLDLTPDEVGRLRSRELKIAGGRPSPVSFDDRWGAIAPGLRARFGGTVHAEVAEERARANAARAPAPAGELRHLPAAAGARDAGAEPVEGARDPREEPDPEGDEFDRVVAGLSAALPEVVTHSGAGLYEVGDGKTYSTIQSALDQLWTDQGSATFTASQFTRVFAGTYDENVEPNAGLVPDITNGHALVVEGDPADSRANVILAPTSGNNAFATKLQHTLVRHMTIDGTAGIAQHTMVATANGYVDPLLEVRDCVVTQGAGADMYAITCPTKSHLLAVDCSISTDGHGINANSWQYYSNGLRVEGCTITRTGAKGGAGIYFWMGGVVRGCVVDGFENGICPANGAYTTAVLENNTVYDCTYAFYFNQGMRDADLVNNIADSCDYAVRVSCWPDEASDTFGGPFTLRNNCWNHGTAFAYDGAGTKTHAQFAALDRVDESGDLDATDPLLTNPASGDYTLQAASPCRRRGHGSGVVSDYQGNAYCPNHPDIGASSTGTSTSAPSITAVAPSASSVVVTVTAGGGPREVAVLVDATGSEIDRQSRLGAGTIALTPSAAGSHFVAAWGADAGDAIIGEPDTWHGQVVVPASGAVTATGPLSLVLENLRTLLANSSTFQSLVGVGDAASAKAFIHYPAADSASWTRPRALIDHLAPSPEHENVGRGSGNTFGESGEAEIVIEASIGTNYRADRQEENAYLEFANKVGAIASEMKGLAGTSGYLDATRFGFTLARGDDDEEAVGAHWYRAEIEIGWGR